MTGKVNGNPPLTDWYPGDVRPERAGVYERDDRGSIVGDGTPNFSYWNGECWSISARTESTASETRFHRSREQCLPWRGLSAPAKESP